MDSTQVPGRTLEELDGMDYGRLIAAVETDRIDTVEDKRRMWLDGAIKDEAMTEDDWKAIQLHDTWMNDGDNG